MKTLRSALLILGSLLVISCNGNMFDSVRERAAVTEMNREAVRDLGMYGAISVMGHRNEDADAVCSAICMAELMRRLDVDATAYVHARPTRGIRFILDRFQYAYPDVKEGVADGEALFLTDHNDPLQSVSGASPANVVGVIDHHSISSTFQSDRPIYYKALAVGASNTVVYTIFRECDIEPSQQIAGIMLSGIIADTDNLTKSTSTATDSLAVEILCSKAGIRDRNQLAREILAAVDDYGGMTDVEILNSELKKYDIEGVELAVADLAASDKFPADALCNRMRNIMPDQRTVLNVDMLFCMVRDVQNGLTHMSYCGEGAKEVAEEAFGPTTHDNCIVVDRVLVRKSDVIPAITEVLSKRMAR